MTIDDIKQQVLGSDYLIVGAGYAGAVSARCLADKGFTSTIIEKRPHIAGNAYDEINSDGILIHTYGPHIYHTTDERVHKFLSKYTKWTNYQHKVLALINGTLMPVPFNHQSIKLAFGEEKGEELFKKLVDKFGRDKKVPIMELRKADDADLQELAEYVYKNIFLYYTMKQWGQSPDEIDPAVTGRVPVFTGDDDRYFPAATWQGMPADGYTKLFQNMLDSDKIHVHTGVDVRDVISIKNNQVYIDNTPFDGGVIYSGPLDELFDFEYGELPYRSLDMHFETLNEDSFQPVATVNYTTSEDFTRITEFKKLTGQKLDGKTCIMKEYPEPYVYDSDMTPYYAIINPENMERYNKYKEKSASIKNFYPVGRLAEYKYYDMDGVVVSALNLCDKLG